MRDPPFASLRNSCLTAHNPAFTGLHLWREWARLETATPEDPYRLPEVRNGYAGLVLSLARQEWPDTSGFDDPEVVWRLSKRHHAGVIVSGDDPQRVQELVEDDAARVESEFRAAMPPPLTPHD